MSNDQDTMSIITDPQNKIHLTPEGEKAEETPENPEHPEKDPKKVVSRRDLLRYGGLAAAVVSVAGAGATGLATGRSDDAYTGYNRTYQGGDMFFNREPFRVETPVMMTPVGKVERPHWTDFLFERTKAIGGLMKSGAWTPDKGVDAIPGEIGDYYRANPERYKMMLEQFQGTANRIKDWKSGKKERYAIADAYNGAFRSAGMYNRYGSTVPEDPHDAYKASGKPMPPEVWDYRGITRKDPLTFKSPAHASKLIKRMAHMFGASLVGITKFDPAFMFTGLMRGTENRGWDTWGDKVPSHWKSVIVLGVPMYWDTTYSAIGYATSFDAYFRSRCAAGLLERFLMELGHPARAQFPGSHYEIMMTPFVLKAGLGEYSRAGLTVTPELGSNFRPAAVITDIEFEYDKPIDIHMTDFCKKCKICADTCPSGAISKADAPETVVRGFKRWLLDEEKCYLQWCSGPTGDGLGCRICVGVCPFTRKNTWIHTISRNLDSRDPTGTVSSTLLAMQHNFFDYPTGEEFRSDWDGGKEANYHKAPWWTRSDEFFNEIEKTWEYHGME